MTDPVTLIVVFLLAVILIAVFTNRLDMIGAVVLAAFILLLFALFGPRLR